MGLGWRLMDSVVNSPGMQKARRDTARQKARKRADRAAKYAALSPKEQRWANTAAAIFVALVVVAIVITVIAVAARP